MSRTIETLCSYEGPDTLFYACPLPPEQLEEIEIEGEAVKAIRPTLPMSFNRQTGLFEPHSPNAVICAGTSAKVVVFHGLIRAAAVYLPPEQRRSGWNEDEHGQVTTVYTTQAMNNHVQSQGAKLKAYVYRIQKTTPPFYQRTANDVFEWRSESPVKWVDEPTEVTGEDWPVGIVTIAPPYSAVEYPSHDALGRPYATALNQKQAI